jgi:hypothetical protein
MTQYMLIHLIYGYGAAHMHVIFVSFSSPSPSSKQKQVTVQEEGPECRDEFSSGSLAGSLASGSSGFGSLSKKRAPIFPAGVLYNNLDILPSALFFRLPGLSYCPVCLEQPWLLQSGRRTPCKVCACLI